MSINLRPRQDDDSLTRLNQGDFGISTLLVADINASRLPPCFQCYMTPSENLENLPYLKSMTRIMENYGSSPASGKRPPARGKDKIVMARATCYRPKIDA
ncbi:FAR1-related protein [Sesbania bispinosa]|nr:FAR1-related protein [Sesbania bispinosa]